MHNNSPLERARRRALAHGFQRTELQPPVFGTLKRLPTKNRRDFETIGAVFEGYYTNTTVSKKLLLPQIVDAWQDLVGPLVAEHTTPAQLDEDVLYVNSNSTVWAAQLNTLSNIVINKINQQFGSNSVNQLKISGPKINLPKYGPRTAKGRLGYRDTFG